MSISHRPPIDHPLSSPDFRQWNVVPFYHPIQNLRTGKIYGFETLARLRRGSKVLQPMDFLSSLDPGDLISLFEAMMKSAIRLLEVYLKDYPDLYVSINVEYSVMMREEFYDRVKMTLADHQRIRRRLVIEVLEQEPIVDRTRMHSVLARLRRLGLYIALDDVGSAYSSLLMIKELPIDVLKLDQAFARDLHKHPDNLLFVLNMLSLARSLGKILVVEGVETADIHDALTILGVEYAQGYAIARPMPAEKVRHWLRAFVPGDLHPRPHSLLGSYAAHLLFVEACRFCTQVPFELKWTLNTADPYLCGIGHYFGQNDLHDSPVGLAHKTFHIAVETSPSDSPEWQRASRSFRRELKRMMSDALFDEKKKRVLARKAAALP